MMVRTFQHIGIGLVLGIGLAVGGHALADKSEPDSGPATSESPIVQVPLGEDPTDGSARVSPDGGMYLMEVARGKGAFVAFVMIEPHKTIGFHRHLSEEYLVVFDGGGVLTLNGSQHTLEEGSAVYMEANAESAFVNGPEPTVFLQVFAGPESADKYVSWVKPPPPTAEELTEEEALTNVNGIRTAQRAYHHEWDAFTSAGWTPPNLPGREPVDFTGGGLDNFHNLGWTSDGFVRCRYMTESKNGAHSAEDDFDVYAECDINGDGVRERFYANRRTEAQMVTE